MLIISLINFSFSFVSFFVADSKVWATLGELLRCATIRARLASKNSALICSRSVANDSLIHPIPPVPDPNPDPALVDVVVVVVVVVVVDGIVIREADLIGSVPGDPQVSAGIGGNCPPPSSRLPRPLLLRSEEVRETATERKHGAPVSKCKMNPEGWKIGKMETDQEI